VLISGLISAKGAPRSLLWLWLESAFELIVCPALLADLERVLLRPKFRPCVTAPEVRAYVALLQRLSSVERDPEIETGLTPDPGPAGAIYQWPNPVNVKRPLALVDQYG
jgi:predicted nucleic acid-binding protein